MLDEERVSLQAPPGCVVALVYQDRTGAELAVTPYTFPAGGPDAAVALPEPPAATPAPSPSPVLPLRPSAPPSASPSSPQPSPGPSASPPGTCGPATAHSFVVVNASQDGRAAQARLVVVEAGGYYTSFSSNRLPEAPFTLSVPEGCRLTVTISDEREQPLGVLSLTVPAGSQGQVFRLAI
jgi:hypothetical protein